MSRNKNKKVGEKETGVDSMTKERKKRYRYREE